jgi:Na+/glutamate symporter
MKVISNFSTDEIKSFKQLKTPATIVAGVLFNLNYLTATTVMVTAATTECASETFTE